jgi:hypothetical protein
LRFGLSPSFETFFESKWEDLFIGLVSILGCNLRKRGQDKKTAEEKTKSNGYKKFITVIFEIMSQWSLVFYLQSFQLHELIFIKARNMPKSP